MLSRERKRFVLPKENSCVLLDWMIVPGEGQREGEDQQGACAGIVLPL